VVEVLGGVLSGGLFGADVPPTGKAASYR